MKRIVFILATTILVALSTFAQKVNSKLQEVNDKLPEVSTDSLPQSKINSEAIFQLPDTIKLDTIVEKEKFKPDPVKAIWMGAIIPGYGQILNKKYWKLPIVYGGFMGFAYAITWNNSRYNSYRNAYRDITDNDPTTNSFINILPKGYEYVPNGGTPQDPTKIARYQQEYTQVLNSAQSAFRGYRDLSIILSVGYYGLVLLEAYVDAHLYDFDISPNLVLNVLPTRIEQERGAKAAYGIQCSLNF